MKDISNLIKSQTSIIFQTYLKQKHSMSTKHNFPNLPRHCYLSKSTHTNNPKLPHTSTLKTPIFPNFLIHIFDPEHFNGADVSTSRKFLKITVRACKFQQLRVHRKFPKNAHFIPRKILEILEQRVK